jgi:transcriptional regulator with XRE-family HTH domain
MKNESLRALMFNKDVSQSHLARQTGVPQPTINRFLNGHTKSPNFVSVLKIAKYFDVRVDQIFDMEIDKIFHRPADHPIFDNFNNEDAETQ